MPIYKYRRWTQEEDRKLKKLYNKKTLNELAGIFDRNWNKVCRRALRLGLKKDKKIFGKWASKTQKAQFKNGERSNKGKRNPNWKGGLSYKSYCSEWKYVREEYKEYDNNECQNPFCKRKSEKTPSDATTWYRAGRLLVETRRRGQRSELSCS